MKLRAFAPFLVAIAMSGILNTRPAGVAAPSIILFHGSRLPKPVFVADFKQNAVLMAAVTQAVNVREDTLTQRPFVEVAMFWGPDWHQYVVDRKPLDVLKPEDANQHGRIYPATDDADALFVFNGNEAASNTVRRIGLARWIDANGLSMLRTHSVIAAK